MNATVLVKCLDINSVGYSHNSRVVLHISLGEYRILAKILCANISLLYNLKISDCIKEELVRDTRTIRTILEKSEKEVIKC
jgi:hypothetical protein